VVLVPCGITAQLDDKQKTSLLACCDNLISKLRDSGLRVRGDFRDHYSPGWKFNHWELKVSNYNLITISRVAVDNRIYIKLTSLYYYKHIIIISAK